METWEPRKILKEISVRTCSACWVWDHFRRSTVTHASGTEQGWAVGLAMRARLVLGALAQPGAGSLSCTTACPITRWLLACSDPQYLFRSTAGAWKAPKQYSVGKGGAPFVGARIPCKRTIATT